MDKRKIDWYKVPENVAHGTYVLFMQNSEWFIKYSDGSIISCHTPNFRTRFQKQYSCVIVDNKINDDDDFICSLNEGFYTVVIDKNLVGRPDLLTFEHTTMWEARSQVKQLTARSSFFCQMAVTHYKKNYI